LCMQARLTKKEAKEVYERLLVCMTAMVAVRYARQQGLSAARLMKMHETFRFIREQIRK
jgi:hypothetical protein